MEHIFFNYNFTVENIKMPTVFVNVKFALAPGSLAFNHVFSYKLVLDR